MTTESIIEDFLLFWDREGNNLVGREVVFSHPFDFVILSHTKNEMIILKMAIKRRGKVV